MRWLIGNTDTESTSSSRSLRTPDAIARLVGAIPLAFPERETKESAFNCRVWVREAIRVLHDHGVVDIVDVYKLEEEFVALGEENDASVVQGGPYKVYWSRNAGVARAG